MHWLNLLFYFWGGVFLANAVPHFVSGIMVAIRRGDHEDSLGQLRLALT